MRKLLFLLVLVGLGAIMVAGLPDIMRYLRIRSM
jgi:Family of unknown function (DUF6893)